MNNQYQNALAYCGKTNKLALIKYALDQRTEGTTQETNVEPQSHPLFSILQTLCPLVSILMQLCGLAIILMTNFFRSHLPHRKQRPWHSFVTLSRLKTEPSQPSYAKLADKGHLYPMNYNQKCVIQLYCYVKYDLMSFTTLVSFFTASFSLSSITGISPLLRLT